jgi:chemotaxis signal transduction protein
MNAPLAGIAGKATQLRLAFDRAFAEPANTEMAAREAILAIHVGAESFAIRLSEISGLHADKKITPVPGGSSALIGIAGFRGTIVPVYSLRNLLGIAAPQSTDGRPPRWMVVAAAAPIGFAFEGFEAQRRVPHEAIVPKRWRAEHSTYVREFVGSRKFLGPILHLPSIVDAIVSERVATTRKEEL